MALAPLAALGMACSAAHAAIDAEPAFRYRAPIAVQQPGAFVQLPLPASAYGRSRQAGLQDLRVVDARGERVPFALLTPRASEAQSVEQLRDAVLYPLPRRPAAGQPWASPIEVVVQGDRISVKRLGGATTASTTTTTAPNGGSATSPPGWLIDTGDPTLRPRDEPPPQALRLAWSGPAEFSAPYDVEVSDDLRTWRAAGSGQLMALAAATGPLTQPSVPLPRAAGRFVRLVWADVAAAPAVTSAKVVVAQHRAVALDAPSELAFAPSAEPPGKTAPDVAAQRALHFDLGGVLPLVQIDVQLAADAAPGAGPAASAGTSSAGTTGSGTRVAPVRIQSRQRLDEPWRDLAQSVFYRIERAATISTSPPVAVQASARYVRLITDERSAPLDATRTRLLVQAPLASLVFATQGQAPYALLTGSADARPGALPPSTLVPALDEERPRFGKASLGGWAEVAEVARQAAADERQAALRPWLLWAVLLAGVAVLGGMVWRLARGRGAA